MGSGLGRWRSWRRAAGERLAQVWRALARSTWRARRLPGLHQLAQVAVHHPQLGEVLHVVGLELEGGFQERDGFLVAAGLQIGGDRFAGGALV
jgi:hypothetical protein